MKKYIIAFILFIISVFILAITIGSGDDDNIYAEHIEEKDDIEQLAVQPSTDLETDERPVVVPDTLSEAQTEVMSELPINKAGLPEQIIKRIAYTVSFNSTTKCPNWVAWKLTINQTDGPFSRKGVPYYEEDGTASGIGVVSNENLKNVYFLDTEITGPRQEFNDWNDKRNHISHGHMMPAGDNKWSKAAMNQSFYLSNMCPQDIDLNGGDWQILERRCRSWANKYKEINIVTGPIFYSQHYSTMGSGKIGIPDAFFKVILRMGKVPKAIGFIFPNLGGHHNLEYYVKTVHEIEDATGFDFFSNVPNNIEQMLESESNLKEW